MRIESSGHSQGNPRLYELIENAPKTGKSPTVWAWPELIDYLKIAGQPVPGPWPPHQEPRPTLIMSRFQWPWPTRRHSGRRPTRRPGESGNHPEITLPGPAPAPATTHPGRRRPREALAGSEH